MHLWVLGAAFPVCTRRYAWFAVSIATNVRSTWSADHVPITAEVCVGVADCHGASACLSCPCCWPWWRAAGIVHTCTDVLRVGVCVAGVCVGGVCDATQSSLPSTAPTAATTLYYVCLKVCCAGRCSQCCRNAWFTQCAQKLLVLRTVCYVLQALPAALAASGVLPLPQHYWVQLVRRGPVLLERRLFRVMSVWP
jgi:hypothetical protein